MNKPPSDDSYVDAARESFDATWSEMYREMDLKLVAGDPTYVHYGAVLEALTSSFGRPIDVLDAGCGTGRYFHRLRQVNRLVGIDLSPDMLEQARNPVRAAEVQAATIDLQCGELAALRLPDASFDFVYSVGVYGEYAPADEALMREFRRLLRPGGVLFLTAVETTSRVSEPENAPPSLLLRVVRKGFPWLPPGVRALLNRRFSPFYTTRADLEQAFGRAGFRSVDIKPYVHLQGWRGTHWDCTARLT
jgi:SAM-dependent methyltransferase